MILIQICLIGGFLIFLYFVLLNPASYQVKAWTKILAILFVVAAILTVAFPNSTNSIAHVFGVARGADLLLYILTMAFIFTIFNGYLQEKRLQRRIVNLARKVAIIEANASDRNKKKLVADNIRTSDS